MSVFVFILILVGIITFGEVATKVGIPLVRRLADLAAGSTGRRAGADDGVPQALPTEAIEALERRLARIEDRLDFIEELRAPAERPALRGKTEEPRS